MKKYFLAISLGFPLLAFLACQSPVVPLSPSPVTPVPTSTPVCVYNSPVSAIGTPVPYSSLPFSSTIVPGQTFVIHNLTDWQAQFGSVPPPSTVNFTTQMIVGGVLPRICSTCGPAGDSLVSVCEDSNQVTALISRPTLSNVCFIAEPGVTQYLVVPQSNLPVVWLAYVLFGC